MTLRFGHLVVRSHRRSAVEAWYASVLGARVVGRASDGVFLSYDDDHHRLAVFDGAPGVAHVAFAQPSRDALIDAYVRLRDAGIAPRRAVDHGVTVSLYYEDPDGGGIELYADVPGQRLEPSRGVPWDPEAGR